MVMDSGAVSVTPIIICSEGNNYGDNLGTDEKIRCLHFRGDFLGVLIREVS